MEKRHNLLCKKAVVLLSVIGGIAAIYMLPETERGWCILIVTIIIFILFIGCMKSIKQLPDGGIIDQEKEFKLMRATELSDVHWIAKLEQQAYSKDDAIPLGKLLEWYTANPKGFYLILADNKRMGHIDILPIKNGDQMFKMFVEGKIREIDLPASSIATLDEVNDTIENLYIESVIIGYADETPFDNNGLSGNQNKQQRYVRQAAIKYLLSNLVPLIKNLTHPKKVKYIYAIAASKAGNHLLTSLGFDIETPANIRQDGHDLFRAPLYVVTKNIAKLLKHTPIRDRSEFDEIISEAGEHGL